jgi:hypothetical protein
MVKLSEIDRFLLYSIQSKGNITIEELKLDEQSGILKIMRNNFSRFWNILTKEQRKKYTKMSINKEELYESLEKIIRYADEVMPNNFLEDFIDVSFWTYSYSIHNIKNEIDDDDKLNNLKHDILRFWIGLTNDEKKKFISIINKYWEENEYNEYFYQKKVYSDDIDYNDKSLYDDHEMLYCVDENLESIDLMTTEDMIYINCSENKIKKLDDLPRCVKTLVCRENKLTSLNNLPPKLKYLDCSYNHLIELLNLPKELIFIKCDVNKITSLDKLPLTLEILICNCNEITVLDKLPEGLKYLNCQGNKISTLNNLPKYLYHLEIGNDKMYYEEIVLPPYLEEFICGQTCVEINFFPNMLNCINLKDTTGDIIWKLPYGLTSVSRESNSDRYNICCVESMGLPKSVIKINENDVKEKKHTLLF